MCFWWLMLAEVGRTIWKYLMWFIELKLLNRIHFRNCWHWATHIYTSKMYVFGAVELLVDRMLKKKNKRSALSFSHFIECLWQAVQSRFILDVWMIRSPFDEAVFFYYSADQLIQTYLLIHWLFITKIEMSKKRDRENEKEMASDILLILD